MTEVNFEPLTREEILAMRGTGVEFGNDEIEGDWSVADESSARAAAGQGEDHAQSQH